MAASGDRAGPPAAMLKAAVDKMAAWVREAEGEALGDALIQIRETGIDPLEAVFASGVRRFDKSGEYKADGALSVTEWLRWRCKLSGGAAAERVEIARQLEKLPKTEAAFANGDLGYQHVAVMARAAEHVGAAAVRKEEAILLQAAQTMDPGRFTKASPRTSSTESTPPGRWPRPTAPTKGATCTSASRSMAWSGSTAYSMPRAARPCGPRCRDS